MGSFNSCKVKAQCYLALLIGFILFSNHSKGQDFSIEEQKQLDSINAVLEDSSSPDTSLASAYFALSNILGNVNNDTLLRLCEKSITIADNALTKEPSKPTRRSLVQTQVHAYRTIAIYHFRLGEYGKSMSNHEISQSKAKEIGDELGIANALSSMALVHQKNGDLKSALTFGLDALDIYQSLNLEGDVAGSHTNIGNVYRNMGNIQKALEHLSEALKMNEHLEYKFGIAITLESMGVIYLGQDEYDKGLVCYDKCLSIYEELEDYIGISYSLISIGKIHQKNGDYDKAIESHMRSLKIMEEQKYINGIAISLYFLALDYEEVGNLSLALDYHNKALKIREDMEDVMGIARSSNSIGKIYLKLGNFSEARTFSVRGLRLAEEMGIPNEISSSAQVLSSVYKKLSNYEEALHMYEYHIQMRDSIKNEETQKATIRQQTKYEFEKAQLVRDQEEQENARLASEATSRRDNLQYSVILIAILVLFGSVLFLGFFKVSTRMAEGIIFFSFLIVFEFLLVLADPYIENWSGGAPGIKLLFNAGIAALIFPAHAFFESRLKNKLIKGGAL